MQSSLHEFKLTDPSLKAVTSLSAPLNKVNTTSLFPCVPFSGKSLNFHNGSSLIWPCFVSGLDSLGSACSGMVSYNIE